ncbi:MAG TPA: archaeosortase/exosortase family protein [Methanomicrobiales archaeon]|nr:archaeosortase/exosortase family protein [Methanomicrobiales archaeon]
MESSEPTNSQVRTVVTVWIVFIALALLVFSLLSGEGYLKLDALSIWVLSALVVVYGSRRRMSYLGDRGRILVVAFGIFLACFSFVNIPIGFGRPPYSIGDFSIFLTGISIAYFGYYRYRSLLIPAAFPGIVVIAWQAYDIYIRNEAWITAPLIQPLMQVTVSLLNASGIPTTVSGNGFSFLSRTGDTISLTIGSDCTGIWSLGTFTAAAIIVFIGFPQSFSKKGGIYLAFGYLGTVLANILRIYLIAVSGYIFGPRGVMENVHVHIGWMIFTPWMAVFWYLFFTRVLQIRFFGKKG